MEQSMKRNTRFRHRIGAEPFNDIYNCFKSIFSTIFSDRFHEGRRSKLYVPVPHVEQQLNEYISGDRDTVAILYGVMGSGKSTILEHYATGHPTRIYLDFSGRTYGMPDYSLEFVNGSPEDRRRYARAAVSIRLNELLIGWCKKYKERHNASFFDFLDEYHPTELKLRTLIAHTDQEKLEILKAFCNYDNRPDFDPTAYVRCFIEFIAKIENYDHFLVIADNVDEQSLETVEAIFHALSDMIICLCRPRPVYGSEDRCRICNTRFRAILACRTHTFNNLCNDDEGVMHTRSYEAIELHGKAILSKILERRLAIFESESVSQQELYVLPNGAHVYRNDAINFVRQLCDHLARHAEEKVIYDLLNHNYSFILRNMKYFLQNRYFLSYDLLILQKSVSADRPFKLSRMLRAMGYGNPSSEDKLCYPAESCLLKNILQWNCHNECSFYAIIKLVKWLTTENNTSDGFPIGFVREVLADTYGIDDHSAAWAIENAHMDGSYSREVDISLR